MHSLGLDFASRTTLGGPGPYVEFGPPPFNFSLAGLIVFSLDIGLGWRLAVKGYCVLAWIEPDQLSPNTQHLGPTCLMPYFSSILLLKSSYINTNKYEKSAHSFFLHILFFILTEAIKLKYCPMSYVF